MSPPSTPITSNNQGEAGSTDAQTHNLGCPARADTAPTPSTPRDPSVIRPRPFPEPASASADPPARPSRSLSRAPDAPPSRVLNNSSRSRPTSFSLPWAV